MYEIINVGLVFKIKYITVGRICASYNNFAFGPTLFFRLVGARVRPGGVWLAILIGFGLSVLFYLLPNTPGDILERLVPFVSGVVVLFFSRVRPT